MAKERYNHKYMHCRGYGCEFKGDCVHFLALQEALALGLEDIEIKNRCKDVTLDYVRVRIEKSDYF